MVGVGEEEGSQEGLYQVGTYKEQGFGRCKKKWSLQPAFSSFTR